MSYKKKINNNRIFVSFFILQWQDQHQKLSCEKFNEWLIANDPNNQAFGLKLILKKNGIGKNIQFIRLLFCLQNI